MDFLAKLTSHGGFELDSVSPDWIIYEGKGWDKLMDWSLCGQVAQRLLADVRKWVWTRANSNEVWDRACRGLRPFLSTLDCYDPKVALQIGEALRSNMLTNKKENTAVQK